MKKNKMLLTAGFMTIATLLAKVLGMVRDALIAANFSTSYIGDAYMTATKLPTMLFDMVIGGVITAAFIPIFNTVIHDEGEEEAHRFANKFITGVFSLTLIITAVGMIFAGGLIGLLARNFSPETHALAVSLTRIMFPMIIFTGIAFCFVGILQSYGEFNIPAVMSLVSNAVVILYFPLFSKRFGVHGLAAAMLVAWSMQVIIQIPSLIKTGFRIKPSLPFGDKNIKSALILAGPLLVCTWVQPFYSLINIIFASGAEGEIATLEYANRLYTVMVGVFSFVVTNLIFPRLSKSNAEEDKTEATALLVTSIKAIFIVILPIMAGFIILSKPVVGIIYQHGAFDGEATNKTALALSCYSAGMIGFAANEIISKAFFSKKNSKTPMINALISMGANIVIASVFYRFIGFCALAAASAVGSSVNAVLNYICMKKKYGRIFEKSDIISILKTVLSAVIMAAAVLAIYSVLKDRLSQDIVSRLILCAVCAGGGAAVYAGCAYAFGVDEIRELVGKKM